MLAQTRSADEARTEIVACKCPLNDRRICLSLMRAVAFASGDFSEEVRCLPYKEHFENWCPPTDPCLHRNRETELRITRPL